jgi:hypothetical protein
MQNEIRGADAGGGRGRMRDGGRIRISHSDQRGQGRMGSDGRDGGRVGLTGRTGRGGERTGRVERGADGVGGGGGGCGTADGESQLHNLQSTE